MNRCDFSSISTCLKNHISESNQMSQPDFLYELFEDFMDDPVNQDFSMDNGLVCRWMTGQAKISPKISAYYSKPSNQEKLAHTIHQNLLPLMSDCNMAIQDIYTLFIQDDSISDTMPRTIARRVFMILMRESPKPVRMELITPFLESRSFHARIRSIKFIHIGSIKIKTTSP